MKTEGIVLQSTPYREYDKIITLFTPSWGLMRLFVKGSRKNVLKPYLTPLSRGEYNYIPRNTLPLLEDATLLSLHDHLRNSLEALELSLKCLKALLTSQSISKGAPQLYGLFVHFLEKFPQSPSSFYASFLLKILKHDGLLEIGKGGETHRIGGELRKEDNSLYFSEEEERMLYFLTETRSTQSLTTIIPDPSFLAKLEILFSQSMNP